MRNIVFYSKSKGDPHSPRLFEILKAMPKTFQSEFVYYCIDPDPLTKKRNDDVLHLMGVTEVPTMYVNGEKYVGPDAFEWLLMQYNQLQMAAGGGVAPGGMGGMYDEPYPPQYGHHQPTMAEMMQMQQKMPGGMGMSLPGVPQMPQMGGFAGVGGRMPPGMGMGMVAPGPMLPGEAGAGSGGPRGGLYGGSGGGGDSAFADPFAPTDITGINSCGLSTQQMLTPIQTKSQDTTSRTDYLLEQYAKERDAMLPQMPPPQTIPGMNMSMAQMAMPQMQMRR